MKGKYFVSISDIYYSEWDFKKGKMKELVVVCDSLQQARKIEREAQKIPEITYIYVEDKLLKYSPDLYDVEVVHYSDLEDGWAGDRYSKERQKRIY